MDGVQLPQGYGHFEEAVYFLPLSSLVYIKNFILKSLYQKVYIKTVYMENFILKSLY